MANDWHPMHTRIQWHPPKPGDLIAHEHAVWRVTAVTNLPLTDADREVWLEERMPDLDTWHGRPYRVNIDWIGGARPKWAAPDGPVGSAHVNVPSYRYSGATWNVYARGGRWPMCSCCGEPMPCRAELQDRDVTKSLKEVEKFAKIQPGCCWGCGEPISRRQKSVTYDGDNLDLPGAPAPTFHTRASCWGWAAKYELRWIAEDPRRERVLTYPKCGGILVVHADGSSECRSGQDMFSEEKTSSPDCRGHLTHDHAVHVACYVGDDWLARERDSSACPRGCRPENHRGTQHRLPRPERRRQPGQAELSTVDQKRA